VRDILVIAIFLVCGLRALRTPLYGLYGWLLVSFGNIHKLGWGLATSLHPGVLMTAATFAGIMVNPKGRFRFTTETRLIVLFWLFTLVTTSFALRTDLAWPKWIQFSKTILLCLVMIYLITDFNELKKVICASTLCLGFYGLKGGIFSLLTGGNYRIYGPNGTFIEDNNELALALNMTLPMIWWLAQDAKTSREKNCWLGLFFFSVIAIIFSYSRGGFLTLSLVLFLIFYKTNSKAIMLTVAGLVLLVGSFYVGSAWIDRMQTIEEYNEDQSAASRIEAWGLAFRFASDHPFLGGGFDAMAPSVYSDYGSNLTIVSDSIYFGTMAEQGFLGFGIYLSIFLAAFRTMGRYRKISCNSSAAQLLRMLKISLMAFLFGGSFYERQYFDYMLYFICVTSIVRLLVDRERADSSVAIPLNEGIVG